MIQKHRRVRRGARRGCAGGLALAAVVLAGVTVGAVPAAAAPAGRETVVWRKPGAKPERHATRLVADLPGFPAPADGPLSPYGGWMGGTPGRATGFFRVEQREGRWWLIDPAGWPYVAMAVNSVSPGTGVVRERAFRATFKDEADWRARTGALLRGAGFNGTGSWSNSDFGGAERLSYTPNWNFMATYGRQARGAKMGTGNMSYAEGIIPVFDPEFAAFADAHARQLARTKDDPWLLGHFSDNEMPFHEDALDRYLRQPAGDAGRQAAERWWRARRGAAPFPAAITPEDRADWLEVVAEKYYATVGAAIRKYDPNHLYIGSRLLGSSIKRPGVVRAIGRHVDIVTINLYYVWTPGEELVRCSTAAGRPVMITEWYAKGMDSGLPNVSGAGWTVATQADRGAFYQNFTLGLLASRVCVGWHYFKYNDNDPTDTKSDPSNRDSNKGIVDVQYRPWTELLRAATELNRNAYSLIRHFDAAR